MESILYTLHKRSLGNIFDKTKRIAKNIVELWHIFWYNKMDICPLAYIHLVLIIPSISIFDTTFAFDVTCNKILHSRYNDNKKKYIICWKLLYIKWIKSNCEIIFLSEKICTIASHDFVQHKQWKKKEKNKSLRAQDLVNPWFN